MARARLLDVPRDEPGQAEAAGALRLDLQPQLRRPPGLQGPHPSGLPPDGRRRRHRRSLRRHPRVELKPSEWAGRQAPSLDDFEQLAIAALESLPQPFRELTRDVRCYVSEFAETEILDDLGIESEFDLMG